MDKATAVQFAEKILSCEQPELLAAIIAQLSSAANQVEKIQGAQEEDTPAIPLQQQQDSVPRYDATLAPILYDYQLVILRNVLASLIPILRFAPQPERTLFRHALEVLLRQAPQLAAQLHPHVQEAIRTRGGNGMEELVKAVNQ